MKNKTYYFAHDYGARNDTKLLRLRADFGNCEGIGLYWCLIELLYEQGGKLELRDLKHYAHDLYTTEDTLAHVIKDFDLFGSDGETFWSTRALESMQVLEDIRAKRAAAGRLGNEKRWGLQSQKIANAKQMQSQKIANININKKEKENKEKITTCCCYQKESEQQQRLLYTFLFMKNFANPKREIERFLDFNGNSDAAHIHADKWGQDKANEGQCFTQCATVLKLCQRAYDNAVKAQDPDAWKIADGLESIRDTAYGTYEIYTANADTSALLQRYFPSATAQKRAGIERITLQTKQ